MSPSPGYRETYAANLRRELPRIPLAADFAAFAKAGERLAALHTGYEAQKVFKLTRVEAKGVKPEWRVERMKLSQGKTELFYNDSFTLAGIPVAAHDYGLGNRSALEWVIDHYRVERDAAGEFASDPNRADDEEYILRLIGQVVTVSVETVKRVTGLPLLDEPLKPAPGTYTTEAEAAAARHFMTSEPTTPPLE